MQMNHLKEYRDSPRELLRVGSLMNMLPSGLGTALDVGARDGHLSIQLADRGLRVTALDLEMPRIPDARIECVKGNAADLAYPDNAFDVVLCAEVLEHIPPAILPAVCREIERVARSHLLIGVPYRQDIRHGRTTCRHCGTRNPPWGHVNSFDESRLKTLFSGCGVARQEYIETAEMGTNAFSAALMDVAGNPFGTYGQDENCIRCGAAMDRPGQRNVAQRIATRLATWGRSVQAVFHRPHANWIHLLLEKRHA